MQDIYTYIHIKGIPDGERNLNHKADLVNSADMEQAEFPETNFKFVL